MLVAIGNIMIGLLAYGAYQDGVDGSGLMVTGAVMLDIQCIFNDCILWSLKFPWWKIFLRIKSKFIKPCLVAGFLFV